MCSKEKLQFLAISTDRKERTWEWKTRGLWRVREREVHTKPCRGKKRLLPEISGLRVFVPSVSGRGRRAKVVPRDVVRYLFDGGNKQILKDVIKKNVPCNGEIKGAEWFTPKP